MFLQLCANLSVKNLIRGRKYQFGMNSYLYLHEFCKGSPCLVLSLKYLVMKIVMKFQSTPEKCGLHFGIQIVNPYEVPENKGR